MALFSPQQQQPETEAEDFTLADSFINFDYVPDMSPQNDNNNNNGSDPIVFGSGSTRVVDEPEPEPEPRCVKLGALGYCGGIEEGIEKISLVGGSGVGGNGGGDDDEDKGHHESESESESSESESGSSSSSTSSTSSATSSDSSDDKKEERDGEKSELEEGEIVESDTDGGDDDDDDGIRAVGGRIRAKNELEILPPVPPVNVTLEPHHQMLPVGVVLSVLGAQVIVEGVEKHDPLNEGSILWITESQTPLGLIDEIFGPVKIPYYIVRYNSENEVPKGIHGGTLISFVPEFANHVLNTNKDLYKKGYDASGVYDEEVSDDADFSDDEKEAEHKRNQRMAKRGINDQNPERRKNKGKKFPPKEGVPPTPTFPVAAAAPLHDHGHCSTFSGNGQGPFGAATVVPPFPPPNAGPNLTPSGVWTNGATLPQPQSAVPPIGFPTNVISWFPANTQISHQWPVPGVPFQQQLNPNQVFPPATFFPGVQPNILAQPMYAQGLGGQNQTTFGFSSPFSQVQPPICAGQQGFPTSELQSETNHNLASSSVPFNHNALHQFHPGASANHGRRTFHPGGRKGWPPAK